MSLDAAFALTAHAATMLRERDIQVSWVGRILQDPQATAPDRHDSRLRHALGRIAEREDRVLRVVYNPTQRPWVVITAYFDRRQRGRL